MRSGWGGKWVFELKTSKVRKSWVFARACYLAGGIWGNFCHQGAKTPRGFCGKCVVLLEGDQLFLRGGSDFPEGDQVRFWKSGVFAEGDQVRRFLRVRVLEPWMDADVQGGLRFGGVRCGGGGAGGWGWEPGAP